ncbi:MAG: cupredoxin domain-containing protein [archaeon]|nr:MAG: cupredoxin domain-containing protein [archaeon]
METQEEPSKPGRGFLLTVGVVMILVGALIGAELAVPLQPGLGGSNPPPVGGSVLMPVGVGSSLQLNFAPRVVTVFLGVNDTVTFVNADSAKHTVTATDHSFDSGDIAPGAKWVHKFTAAGNFTYFCLYHQWMQAKVVVKDPSTSGVALGTIPTGTGSNTNLGFSPKALNLVSGVNNTVIFSNQDTVKHTVTASDGSFDSGDILPGGTWSHTFGVGSYSFKCIYHSYMTGSVVVKAP